jgi:hypothetical protein
MAPEGAEAFEFGRRADRARISNDHRCIRLADAQNFDTSGLIFGSWARSESRKSTNRDPAPPRLLKFCCGNLSTNASFPVARNEDIVAAVSKDRLIYAFGCADIAA